MNIQIKEWLTAGPYEVFLPAFNSENNLDGKIFKVNDLLIRDQKEVKDAVAGQDFLKWQEETIQWKKQKSNKDGVLTFRKPKNENYALNWQAVYINCKEYTQFAIEVTSPQCFVLHIDGEKVLSKLKFDKNGNESKKKTKELELEPGKHFIVIKSLFSKSEERNWKIKTNIKTKEPENIELSLAPSQFMNVKLLLEGQQLTDAPISADGKYVMLHYKEVFSPSGKTENWFEVKECKNGNVVYNSRGRKMTMAKWGPTGHLISYSSNFNKKHTIALLNIDNSSIRVLLQNKEGISNYTWSKDGAFIVYSITEKPKENEKGVYKIEGMPDRQPWWRMRSQLFKLNIDDLSIQRLTYGFLSNNLHDISPDGEKLLISHDFPNFSERPYSKQVLMELKLADLSIDTIWEKTYGGSATYSPDGKELLVTGSPVLFGETGKNVSANKIPNDYDTQAYIYDLHLGTAKPITKDFNPSIMFAKWNALDKLIYFIGQDRTYRKIYVFNPVNNTIEKLDTKVDVVKKMSLANKSQTMTYTGSSISYPSVCFNYDLSSKQQFQLANPEETVFEKVKFGKTEDWDFKSKAGLTIEGRIYYPPDFKPEQKYPMIVYYYGGTSPTDRSFRGRYPKNLFAAMGYVVYVIQPSGATGYGQEFSALHVNNWGITVADEIISGTKLFLAEHDFVDPERVGCLGASYGGFMTMLLVTRTDIFAAAISHAGISSISSYWGEGFWGYSYSSVASANSFPWNNPKLYVEQSPLFHADKVSTPLLLLHGDADTNVPPGESIQMYTALKLLGKEVELVEVKGQNHHILDYKKRIRWQKTILAWFDKWLKGDSSWWDALYPEKNL